MRLIVVIVALMVLGAGMAQAQPPPFIGDYDAELRTGEHVDCELMIERLTELGANTYMWLIWHSPNDWEDLHTFLPLAQEAGITVWVYLVPPSETAATHPQFPYLEPFRLDYKRWAEEIAKLSLEYDNLVGYVIDDFWGNVNPNWFTPESIEAMIDAGRAINPDIKFYPLMYYRQIGPRFAELLGPLVDGVVAAYPRDREMIERALPFLHDDYAIASHGVITYPWDAPSTAGEGGFLTQTARVTDAANASLTVSYRDDFAGPTEGYHFMQVRVGDEVAWEEDVAGADEGVAEIDLSELVAGREQVTIALGVFDRQGVGNFGVTAAFPEVAATGLELRPMDDEDAWQADARGQFSAVATPPLEGHGQFHLPLIVMPSGQRGEFEKRNQADATSERIAAKVAMVLELVREGKVAGMVTYCLDKSPGNPDFDAVKQVIGEYRAAREANGEQ